MSFEKTQCPKCGQGFRFAPEHLGMKTRCKSCQHVFVIQPPASAAEPPVPAQAQAAPPKPAQSNVVPARPIQAKPVPTQPAPTKPPQTQPAQVQAVPATSRPQPQATSAAIRAVPVADKPANQPAPPQKQPPVKQESPYEAFVDEVMTGVGDTVQKVAALPTGSAESYLATNKKLNFGKAKKRDGDWATTFIFRGINLALFGFLLFGISMVGFSFVGLGNLLIPLTSPICAAIALMTGLIGSVMVVVGFAAKPGSAAVFGLIPILMFIACGIWLGSRFVSGHWNMESNSMAKVADQNRNNQNRRPAGADQIRDAIRKEQKDFEDMAARTGIPELEGAMKRAREQQEAFMKRNEERRKQRDQVAARDPFANQRNQPPVPDPVKPAQPKPQAPPPAKVEIDSVGTGASLPAKQPVDPFEQWDRVKPTPDQQADAKQKPVSGDETQSPADTFAVSVESSPFPNDHEYRMECSRKRIEYERNSMKQFGGIKSKRSFPQKNLVGQLGKSKRANSFGSAMTSSDQKPILGFLTVASFARKGCDSLVPVFDTNDKASSIAKPGYALGGIEASFQNSTLVAIRGIYMKLDGNKLDSQDRYFGTWLGDADAIRDAQTIETTGRAPIGLRVEGLSGVESISLIVK